MHIRRTLVTTAVATLAVAGVQATVSSAAAAPALPSSKATYIVTVAPGTAPAAVAARAAHGLGGQVEHVYTAVLNGFAISVPPAAADRLTKLPGVIAVEPDQIVQVKPGVQPAQTSPGVPWGLDRIDQRDLPLSEAYSYTATGAGVTAYIIDTGIAKNDSDFGGRAAYGYDEVDNDFDAADCNGHGTHVAGTVGGSEYGVAKQVDLVAVRVLNCSGSGTNAGVIAGVDWVTADHAAKVKTGIAAPAVANMSLGGGASTALDTAVADSITSGVTYAVAAGNGNAGGRPQDACKYSPARVSTALTVGASDKTDAPASFSNYGACVDLFAPGVGIISDWYTSDSATNTISGTSMATPHVAGVAALYLQGAPSASPETVNAAVKDLTTKGKIKTSKTANNDLLFSNY